MASDATQSTVASSSTLWAQASKEWVIPAKPKPGRKPKKDSAASKETHEVDAKGRRVQNRAAQRAFRERKQSQLAELQARVQSYERGEIERNVALQQISKHLKEENDRLKSENAVLKDEISRLKGRTTSISTSTLSSTESSHHDKVDAGKAQKRWREDSGCPLPNDDTKISLHPTSRKRFRPGIDSPPPSTTPAPQYTHAGAYVPSSPSITSSPDSNGFSRSPFSPVSFAPLPAPSESGHASSTHSTSVEFSASSGDAYKGFDALGASPPFDNFDCGLCTENTPCVCRELAMQQGGVMSGITGSLTGFGTDYLVPRNESSSELKVEETESRVANSISNIIEIPSASEEVSTSTNSVQSNSCRPTSSWRASLAENHTTNSGPYQIHLPSPEPPPSCNNSASTCSVPLRLNNRRRSTSRKVWQVNSAAPTCSGDPSNCPACKDDDFGKAFCRALGDSASVVVSACDSCPNPEACGKDLCSAGARFGPVVAPDASSVTGDPRMNGPTSTGPGNDSLTSTGSAQNSSDGSSIGFSSLPTSTSKTLPSDSSDGKSRSERIPANEAWARLKSHPNIAFADLSMLADVVARRTKCSGPVAVIHPAPGSITPERDTARSPVAPGLEERQNSKSTWRKDRNSVLLTDPHVLFRAQEQKRVQYSSEPPREATSSSLPPSSRVAISSALSLGPGAIGRPELVPQEELRECGRRRIREVDVAGVREALRILDAQFGKHT